MANKAPKSARKIRNLVIILGDQLDEQSAVFDDFDKQQDAVWMAEVEDETTHVKCHQLRIAIFLSAMRHFRDLLIQQEFSVHYHELKTDRRHDSGFSHADVLGDFVEQHSIERLVIVQPGDYRVLENFRQAAAQLGIELQIRPDRHFYASLEDFQSYADGKKSFLLETFYRHMRKRHRILVDENGDPEGGQLNFDHDNRKPFGKYGPGKLPARPDFAPDQISRDVIAMVGKRFHDHPGSLEDFNHPVTRIQAQKLLHHFVKHGLELFGPFEDAMWSGEPFLYHSLLSLPLNLKLISPQECLLAAINAYQQGQADLPSVEGFTRQILGWREFIRGIYWLKMPDYATLNALDQQYSLPDFYWTGKTSMACVQDAMQNVIRHGYTHHIQRLMVLGNLAQTLGAHPLDFHQWHMAMYLDAIDWVSLPNALGMSQYGDGGIVGTKPYCSTGNYIHKMSNYCKSCSYNYKEKTGENACPLSTFYWDFLDRNYETLKDNPRMGFAIKNLERLQKDDQAITGIRERAQELRTQWGVTTLKSGWRDDSKPL